MTNKIEHWQLLSRQAQPLEMKIRIKSTHPKLHEWCGNLGLWEVLEYIGVPHE